MSRQAAECLVKAGRVCVTSEDARKVVSGHRVVVKCVRKTERYGALNIEGDFIFLRVFLYKVEHVFFLTRPPKGMENARLYLYFCIELVVFAIKRRRKRC